MPLPPAVEIELAGHPVLAKLEFGVGCNNEFESASATDSSLGRVRVRPRTNAETTTPTATARIIIGCFIMTYIK